MRPDLVYIVVGRGYTVITAFLDTIITLFFNSLANAWKDLGKENQEHLCNECTELRGRNQEEFCG